MKRTLLMLILLISIKTTSFSQIKFEIQAENRSPITSLKDYSFNINEDFNLNEDLIGIQATKNLNKKSFNEENLDIDSKENENLIDQNNPNSMPCWKPKGNCPIKVFTPDSTVRHSLLIKPIE